MTGSFDLVPIHEIPPELVISVINEAFGRSESLDWFHWKHQDGPWGPSVGVAAVDGSDVLGVRLLLPWRFRDGERTLLTHRATEAATIPRAQGRGVFMALNRWAMEQIETQLIWSTSNELSQGGYRKLGWQTLGDVTYRWEAARWPLTRGAVVTRQNMPTQLASAWDVRSLEWRADPRCRHDYVAVSDASGTRLYFRSVRRLGVTGVAPLGLAPHDDALASLWDMMLESTRARFVLRPSSQPSPTPRHPGITRGHSLILGWTPKDAERTIDEWASAGIEWLHADLEAVI